LIESDEDRRTIRDGRRMVEQNAMSTVITPP